MVTKTFKAKSTIETLQLVQNELGSDAIVVSMREVPIGPLLESLEKIGGRGCCRILGRSNGNAETARCSAACSKGICGGKTRDRMGNSRAEETCQAAPAAEIKSEPHARSTRPAC